MSQQIDTITRGTVVVRKNPDSECLPWPLVYMWDGVKWLLLTVACASAQQDTSILYNSGYTVTPESLELL